MTNYFWIRSSHPDYDEFQEVTVDAVVTGGEAIVITPIMNTVWGEIMYNANDIGNWTLTVTFSYPDSTWCQVVVPITVTPMP